jgi:bifunctional non-homologous end joining protein LigD
MGLFLTVFTASSDGAKTGQPMLQTLTIAPRRCDESGQPDFRALMSRRTDCDYCLWAFDLLAFDGQNVTAKPLFQRRTALQELLNETDDQGLQFSMAFDDPVKLLAAAERMGLEGIVSKRRYSRYVSGASHDWIKVKTAAWREANKDRGELFEDKKSRHG